MIRLVFLLIYLTSGLCFLQVTLSHMDPGSVEEETDIFLKETDIQGLVTQPRPNRIPTCKICIFTGALLMVAVLSCNPRFRLPSKHFPVTSALHEDATSGVSGNLWTAEKSLRAFAKPRVFHGEISHTPAPKVVTGEELDRWFLNGTGGHRIQERNAYPATECKSDKWVVITTIFGPTKLIHQLDTLTNWCTVVVADSKTPVDEWRQANLQRVRLLTLEEQSVLPLRILSFIPRNHFGRKNIGYLYAIKAGAKHVYDTDDDNVLKLDPNGAPIDIPIVDAMRPPHFVAQAWHCKFEDGKTRSWNPYALYGKASAWPRGLPLEDISITSRSCGHSSVKDASTSNYTYHKVFHQLPGISFAVQQSLADVHPDVDAIYRLTHSPPTLVFDSAEKAEGVYAPDNVFAPYNAQATLHSYSAFWAMLLPISVHGRVSDIWRSYFAQRLMQKYGLRVAFMKPWVDQERTAHNFLKDFDSEQPLYIEAGGVLDFLRAWQPSHPHLSLPSEYEELVVALYEHGVLEETDVLLTQAWLQDLLSIGYQFPDNNMTLYESWTSERFLGGMSILVDEHSNGADIRRLLPVLNTQLSMFAANKYPVMIFYVDIGIEWMSGKMKAELRRLAPNLRLEFYGTQYTWPQGYSFNGYMYCSQFLGYEIYRHPALQRLEYLFRVDEDVTSFTNEGQAITLDFFDYMSVNNITLVNFQHTQEADWVINNLCSRSESFFVSMEQAGLGAEAWSRVNETFCKDRWLVGGYIELYNLRKMFLNPLYFAYLESIDYMQGVYRFDWREQSPKSIWLVGMCKKEDYRYMRDMLPVLKHKGQDWR